MNDGGPQREVRFGKRLDDTASGEEGLGVDDNGGD